MSKRLDKCCKVIAVGVICIVAIVLAVVLTRKDDWDDTSPMTGLDPIQTQAPALCIHEGLPVLAISHGNDREAADPILRAGIFHTHNAETGRQRREKRAMFQRERRLNARQPSRSTRGRNVMETHSNIFRRSGGSLRGQMTKEEDNGMLEVEAEGRGIFESAVKGTKKIAKAPKTAVQIGAGAGAAAIGSAAAVAGILCLAGTICGDDSTPSPTSLSPQTSAPTKRPVKTSSPTSFTPTSKPTTSLPTSSLPTTISPTTSSPTTSSPTTSSPTTISPTTSSPTTNSPTTSAVPTLFQSEVFVFGSSVAFGTGATNNLGYANLMGQDIAQMWGWDLDNQAIGGYTTSLTLTKVDEVFATLAYIPKVAILGLSTANEGLLSTTNAAEAEAIKVQFEDGIVTLVNRFLSFGVSTIVVGSVYPQNDYTALQYTTLQEVWTNSFQTLPLLGNANQNVVVTDFLTILDDGMGG